VRVIAEQTTRADALVDEAPAAGLEGSHVTVQATMLRQEPLQVKGDLERMLIEVDPPLYYRGIDAPAAHAVASPEGGFHRR
jgi:hypothetical protein